MFFYLSKTIYFLLMPLGLILICFVLAWKLKRIRWKRYCRYAGIFLCFLFTNPFLSNEFIGWWEYKPVPLSQLQNQYDLAIVLTGIADNQREPKDRVYFNKGADRITHTVQLYKMGKVKKILLAGGSGSFGTPDLLESDNLKRAMVMMGVPDSLIMVENKSKNTHQSAVNTAEMLEGQKYDRVLLITSAFHMRRAYASFTKAGMQVNPFPADFYASKRAYTPNVWIPNPGAMVKWTVLFHEILGLLTYKVMGYA